MSINLSICPVPEVKVNECASNPCKNDGRCIDGTNKFSCECKRGWTGTTCSIGEGILTKNSEK